MKIRLWTFALLLATITGCGTTTKNINKRKESLSQIKYSNYISAIIGDTRQTYPQFNMQGVNTSNAYFPNYQNLWMQAMTTDSESREAQNKFTITLYNVNLDRISYPYTLDPEESNEAVIGWYDKEIIASKGTLCEGCDNSCMYMGSLKERQIKVILTSKTGNIVEGTFEGNLYLRGTGFSRFIETEDFQNVRKGRFKILFRTDK